MICGCPCQAVTVAVTVTVSFSVTVSVTVNIWLGGIGVMIKGPSEVNDDAEGSGTGSTDVGGGADGMGLEEVIADSEGVGSAGLEDGKTGGWTDASEVTDEGGWYVKDGISGA